MSDILWSATRSRAFETKLKARIGISLVSLALLAWVLMSGGIIWLTWLAIIWVGMILALQIKTLMTSRQPLTLSAKELVIASSMRVAIDPARLTGLARDPKDGGPGLGYRDGEQEQEGVLRLPWKLIAEPQDEVLAALRTHYGLTEMRGTA